jgi:hypothetical protein
LEDCRTSTTLTGIIIDKSLIPIEMRRYEKSPKNISVITAVRAIYKKGKANCYT